MMVPDPTLEIKSLIETLVCSSGCRAQDMFLVWDALIGEVVLLKQLQHASPNGDRMLHVTGKGAI